jgi:hypothetical protein
MWGNFEAHNLPLTFSTVKLFFSAIVSVLCEAEIERSFSLRFAKLMREKAAGTVPAAFVLSLSPYARRSHRQSTRSLLSEKVIGIS